MKKNQKNNSRKQERKNQNQKNNSRNQEKSCD